MIALKDLHVVILAGGLGTRVRDVLGNIPKPMAEIGGRPFLAWVLAYLQRQGCTNASVSTGFSAEVVDQYFALQPVSGIQVRCHQEPRPLGTAGGFFYTARQVIKDAGKTPEGWLVLNGDSLLLADLRAAVVVWQQRGTPAAILARHVDDADRYGLLRMDSDDTLREFCEKSAAGAGQPGWINAGVYFLRQDAVEIPSEDEQPVLSFERDIFPALLKQGCPIAVLKSAGAFLDIGTPESLKLAPEFIAGSRTFFEGRSGR